jgi:hypothetical protein
MNILISFLITLIIVPIIFIYANYENNFKLLYYKYTKFCLMYGAIYGIISASLTYLITREEIFTDLVPEFIMKHKFITAIFIGLSIKQLVSLVSFEVKNKEIALKAIPKFIDEISKKRMNDFINKYYHEKSVVLEATIKNKKIHNISNFVEESLPIQIVSIKRKKYISEFKLLKTNESKLIFLGYKFGENVFKICETKINNK